MVTYNCKIFSSPTKFFILNFFFWGIIFLFLVPPFQAPDEQVHFPRVFELSCGKILLSKGEKVGGANLPASIQEFTSIMGAIPFHKENKFDYKTLYQHLTTPTNEKETTFITFSTQLYSPFQYLPQVLGISVGKIFDVSICVLYYLGRLFSLCIIGILLYLSIKYIPFNKWALVMLCLSPMSLFLAVSHSSDPMIFACSFLLIAIVLRTMYDTSFRLSVSIIGLLLLCIATLATSKFGSYFPILLIVLLIPTTVFSDKRTGYIFKLMLFAIGIALALFWNLKTKFIFDELSEGNSIFSNNIHNLCSYEYIQLVLRTFIILAHRLYLSFFTLGWLDTPLPSIMCYCWGFLLILLTVFSNSSIYIYIPLFIRIFFLFIPLVISIGIVTSMYLGCGTTGENVINGIQGRYFFPISMLVLLTFSNLFLITKHKFFQKIKYTIFDRWYVVQLFLIVFLMTTVYVVFQRYYVS